MQPVLSTYNPIDHQMHFHIDEFEDRFLSDGGICKSVAFVVVTSGGRPHFSLNAFYCCSKSLLEYVDPRCPNQT